MALPRFGGGGALTNDSGNGRHLYTGSPPYLRALPSKDPSLWLTTPFQGVQREGADGDSLEARPSSLTLQQSPHPQTQMLPLTQLGFRPSLPHRSQNSLR